jgi:hypothetical protein
MFMSNHLIEYTQYQGWSTEDSILYSPLSLDGVGYDLVSEYSEASKDAIYYPCPAWKHKSNRIYTVRSPIDLTFSVNVPRQYISTPNLVQEQFNAYFEPTFTGVGGWCSEEKTTIQLSIPRFLFWTKKKNIWMEQRSHPLTAINNFVCIPGWFNISNWTRPLSFAIDLIDSSKPVVIKRGDPLYQISFYSENQDDGFILKKSEPPKNIRVAAGKTSSVVDLFAGKIPQSIKNNLFKNKTSECPFKYLWK